MTFTIEAKASIIEWDAEMSRMAIANPGDVIEVGEKLANTKIETGEAKATKKSVRALGGDDTGEAKADAAVEPAAADPEPAVDDASPAPASDSDEAPAG